MRTQRTAPIPFLLAAAVLFAGGCDDDGSGVTDPILDVEPPSIAITSAPAESRPDFEMVLQFTVTDDWALEVVTVDWGVPGEPLETIPVEGKNASLSCTHTFAATGQYTIVLRVRDASGRETMLMHDVSVTKAPPDAPVAVAVAVNRVNAVITWTPGAWATRQEVTLSRTDASEPDRVQPFQDRRLASFIFTGLSWDADYEVVVTAINDEGRTESAPVAFRTPALDPPALTRFSARAEDPTCLVVDWTLAAAADNYRVAIRGNTEADSFDEVFGSTVSEAEFCAAAYPLTDEMTYVAQVFAVLAGKQYGSNLLAYAVDLDPVYSATESWTATWLSPAGESEILRLYLQEEDGVITGTWECDIFMAEPSYVSGTRTWAAIDLTLHFTCSGVGYCPPNSLVGVFTDADTIEAQLDVGFFDLPLTLRRD